MMKRNLIILTFVMILAMAAPVAAVTIVSIDVIDGTAQVGQTLTAGALTPGGTTDVIYAWQNATTAGGVYTAIPGATGTTYVVQPGDKDNYIEVVATGHGVDDGTATSVATAQVSAQPLSAIAVIGGTAQVGQTLTAGA